MDALKRLYDNSPRVLQKLYVNAYGLRNRSRLRQWNRLLDEIEYTERLDRPGQVAYVESRLRDILLHAIRRVPFYRPYTHLENDIRSGNVFDLLDEFPVIDKEAVNARREDFLAGDTKGAVVSRTSGTTGIPFKVFMAPETFLLGDALWWRRTRWAGYEKGDWIARLVGDPVIPLKVKDPAEPWVVSYLDKRIYLSTFHLTERTAARIGEMLSRRRPAYIMGYPSSLEILCKYLEQQGFEMEWDLKNVLFSSEPMHAHQEMVIGKVLGAPIRGLYGSGEKIISAAQCAEGRYHLSLVDGYVEGQFGLRPCLSPAAVTTLINRQMPLIRYQVGDEISMAEDQDCPCGRTLPIMSPVITKHEDYILTPSGRKISPSSVVWAFIHLEIKDINRGQVVQEDERRVTVYLNASPEVFDRYHDMLQKSMVEVFFGEMEVSVVRTDEIDVQKSGKSRFIVNKLRHRFHDVSTGAESG